MITVISFLFVLVNIGSLFGAHSVKRHISIDQSEFQQSKRLRIDVTLDTPPAPQMPTMPTQGQEAKSAAQQEDSVDFIYDTYTAARGKPQMLEISCASCMNYIMNYQKDGPGRLLRCYLDRIRKPSWLAKQQYQPFSVRTSPNLRCNACHTLIGTPMMYRPEQRPAYRMISARFLIKK